MAYLQNKDLKRSLLPLFAASLILLLVEQIQLPGITDSNWDGLAANLQSIPFLTSLLSVPFAPPTTTSLPSSSDMDLYGSVLMDIASMLFLVRMTKIIGVDRDAIIADKVSAVCREFPVRIIVMIL